MFEEKLWANGATIATWWTAIEAQKAGDCILPTQGDFQEPLDIYSVDKVGIGFDMKWHMQYMYAY